MFVDNHLTFKPLTLKTWEDLERLFKPIPAPNMCWCMYWRKTRAEWWGKSSDNKHCLKEIVESGKIPGILAYWDDNVGGWCSITPRSEFPGLDRSPTLKPIDDAVVWSITCFVIAKPYKRQGVATALTQEAIRYAASQGAQVVEAYPIYNPGGKYRPVGESFMGFVSTFERMGFVQVSHRSKVRNIMRYYVDK